MERMRQFLLIASNAQWRSVPPVWNEELRRALSDKLIKIGWGGVIEVTDAGRAMMKG